MLAPASDTPLWVDEEAAAAGPGHAAQPASAQFYHSMTGAVRPGAPDQVTGAAAGGQRPAPQLRPLQAAPQLRPLQAPEDEALPIPGRAGQPQVQQSTGPAPTLYSYTPPSPPSLPRSRSESSTLAPELEQLPLQNGGSSETTPLNPPLITSDYRKSGYMPVHAHQRFRELWPHYFSLGILATFSAPIVSGLHLAQDPSVRYWVGSYGYIPALIPAYLACCHAWHMRLGLPKLIPVVLSTIVPCVVIFLVGNFHLSATGIVANMLLSKDCTTFAKKQEVHQAWVTAAELYDSCINRTSVEQGIKYEDGLKLYRLHECKEYYPQFYGKDEDPWSQYRDKWNYLRKLEENTYCSGWCWETRPLWAFSEVNDPCSVAAGAMLMGKVKPLAMRMMIYGMVAIFCSIVGIIYMGHEMRKEGYEWDRL